MAVSRARAVGQALGRIRVAVNTCCWMIGLCLMAQLIIWSILTYTEVRYEVVEPVSGDAPLVVTTDQAKTPELKSAAQVAPGSAASAAPVSQGAMPTLEEPLRVLSRHDRMMRAIAMFTGGLGTLAMIALLPLLTIGVVLCAGSATPGVDRTVSAFAWAVLLALVILPVGGSLGLALSGGAFSNYSQISMAADAARAGSADHVALVYYGRFLVLPMACAVGVTFIALRFGAGVELGLVPWDEVDYDPTVEREATGVKPGSLVGGRAGGALGRMLTPSGSTPAAVGSASDKMPSATKVAQGEAPRRLI